MVGGQELRHAAAASASIEPVHIRFPHCGEQRLVRAPPASLLRNLPGYTIEVAPEVSTRQCFVLRGPSTRAAVEDSQSPRGTAQPAGGTVSAGPLELRAPQPGETVSQLARRLEDDGLLYLPNALSLSQIEQLKASCCSMALSLSLCLSVYLSVCRCLCVSLPLPLPLSDGYSVAVSLTPCLFGALSLPRVHITCRLTLTTHRRIPRTRSTRARARHLMMRRSPRQSRRVGIPATWGTKA